MLPGPPTGASAPFRRKDNTKSISYGDLRCHTNNNCLISWTDFVFYLHRFTLTAT